MHCVQKPNNPFGQIKIVKRLSSNRDWPNRNQYFIHVETMNSILFNRVISISSQYYNRQRAMKIFHLKVAKAHITSVLDSLAIKAPTSCYNYFTLVKLKNTKRFPIWIESASVKVLPSLANLENSRKCDGSAIKIITDHPW